MKISVLTVCHNAEATISRTIASFLAQDYPSKELIVIDGASTDDTMKAIDGYRDPSIRVLSEPDQGMYDALNKGLKLYSGDAVGVLNADDRYHDERVLTRISEGLKEYDAVHGDLDFHNSEGRIARRWRGSTRPSGGFSAGWMPAHPTFYVHRRIAEAVGAFNTKFKTAADYDWMLRAIEIERCSQLHIPYVMVDMALGGRSTSSAIAHLFHNLEALDARRRWLGSGIIDWALVAKPASKLRQFVNLRDPAT